VTSVPLPQATEWASNEDTRRSCQSKGKTEVRCLGGPRGPVGTGRKLVVAGWKDILWV
jgi:chondroitin sulfate proteoglycan 4